MTSAPALAIDLSRLVAGALRDTPRGIDRVELLYARHYLQSWAGDCFSVLALPWGTRTYTREEAMRGVDAICAHWGEDGAGRGVISRRLAGFTATLAAPRSLGGRPEKLPTGALYLNVGHTSLSQPRATAWLRRRPDVRAAFMLHDVIPLQHPAYFTPSELRYFRRILDMVPRARGVIFNSQAVAEAYAAGGEPQPPFTLVQPLPVEPAFLQSPPSVPRQPAYFVACGEMEARKNFGLLIDVWRALAGDDGPPIKLVIVGGRGNAASDLFAKVRQWDPDARHVEARHGLTTPQLRDLLQGAVALLAPSRAEGFDLPVTEALALGVPVLASDIPVHRETGRSHALHLSPFDAGAWLAAIRRLHDEPAELARRQALARTFRPLSPATYFRAVTAFLHRLTQEA